MQAITPRQLCLQEIEGDFAICKLPASAAIPMWATSHGFFSITRTSDELSIVCTESIVPENVPCDRGWRCLRVVGSMAFTEIGVLTTLVAPLSGAGISVFAISTFDTDYLLVKANDWPQALESLTEAGHWFQ